jgi:hypothetical protein
MRSPSSDASAAFTSASAAISARVALDDELGRALSVSGISCATCASATAAGIVEVAAVFVQRAVEQREQRRLAGAVAPDQTDLLARVDGDGSAVQQHLGAAAQGDALEGDHGGTLRKQCECHDAGFARRGMGSI